MGRPFEDITLYVPTPYARDNPKYWEETSLHNYMGDLYVRKMKGYKPPNAARVTIQPAYFGIWQHTWKNGSIFSVAVEFRRDDYELMDRRAKCRYILDMIQDAMIQLCNEHGWDRSIFERVYEEIIFCNFEFVIDYPIKGSRDRMKHANLHVEKSATTTFAFAIIEVGDLSKKIKLFEKRNSYWYDCIYKLARYAKWLDSNKFGISYSKGLLEAYYSLTEDKVFLLESGVPVHKIEFSKFFYYQLEDPAGSYSGHE